MKLIKVTKKDSKKADVKEIVWDWIHARAKQFKKYPYISPTFSLGFTDPHRTSAEINWSAIGGVSVSEAEEFAKNILAVCAEIRKADKEAVSKFGLKSGI